MAEAVYVNQQTEIASDLDLLGLDLEKLREVVRYADSERALCNKNDPKGFPLITVNAKAARGLREQFCGETWMHDETDNQPGILNATLGIRVIPCNFDENAGNRLRTPTNRAEKGAASGSKVRCNGTGWLPGLEAPPAGEPQKITTLILGIYSEDGQPLRAELSYPTQFSGSRYTEFSKRIELLNGTESDSTVKRDSTSSEPTESIDIEVKRR